MQDLAISRAKKSPKLGIFEVSVDSRALETSAGL